MIEKSPNLLKSDILANFIYYGGIPEYAKQLAISEKQANMFAQSILKTIVEKDIFKRLNITNKHDFNKILDFILDSAVVSVPSNIVEGMARLSSKDQTHFLNIEYGSLMELYAQLDIAHDLGYLNEDDFIKIETHIDEIDKMIVSLTYIRKQTSANGNKK